VGLDNIDMEACRARNVQVIPAVGANAPTVAEYVIGSIIILLRRGLFHRTQDILTGKWPRMATKGHDAFGKRLGIVGFGYIGREVAQRASALGMHVSAHDPYVATNDEVWNRMGVERCELPALLAESDIVSIHTPAVPETLNLIDATALARMKSEAVLINTARGGIVNESALVEALRAGRLGGAMLDVFDQEPFPERSDLADVPNLYLTAHDAGYSEEAFWRQGDIIAKGVRNALRNPSKT
jgi:(S)-sulfolactate dehydrogenase